MGLNFSALYAQPHEQPKTVLVPPYFERDLKARSRMVRSSYDYLFGKPSLRWLFTDYFGEQLNAVLYFAPSADPRISVKAKLGAGDAGAMSIRYQPLGALEPQCFLDVKANPRSPGDIRVRACAFSTDTGMGAFATLPLAKQISGQRAEVGLRYSSTAWTAGVVVQPATSVLSQLWLVGRANGITAGLQLLPGLPLLDMPSSFQRAVAAAGSGCSVAASAASAEALLQKPRPAAAAAAAAAGPGSGSLDAASIGGWLRDVSNVAVSYSPPGRTRSGQPAFTATVEMQQGRTFLVSFFQHVAAVRQVFNPFEKDDVIGITNYVDIGLQLAVPLVAEGDGGPPGAAGLQLGGSWQVNKNVLLKGKLGTDSLALLAAFKSWFNPSVAGALAAQYCFRTNTTRLGLTVQVENFGALRYERSREAMVHGRVLTQRHEATAAEEAMAEGDRPLVQRGAVDEAFNVPEPASVNYL